MIQLILVILFIDIFIIIIIIISYNKIIFFNIYKTFSIDKFLLDPDFTTTERSEVVSKVREQTFEE